MGIMPTNLPLRTRWSSLRPDSSRSIVLLLLLLGGPAAGSQQATEKQQEARIKQNAFRPGATPPVPLLVGADGRACSGYAHLTKNSFIWKWSWATCRADGWSVINRGPQSWTIKLKQTPAEVKACLGVRYVEIEPTDPDLEKSEWSMAGMLSSTPDNVKDPIACSSMI